MRRIFCIYATQRHVYLTYMSAAANTISLTYAMIQILWKHSPSNLTNKRAMPIGAASGCWLANVKKNRLFDCSETQVTTQFFLKLSYE